MAEHIALERQSYWDGLESFVANEVGAYELFRNLIAGRWRERSRPVVEGGLATWMYRYPGWVVSQEAAGSCLGDGPDEHRFIRRHRLELSAIHIVTPEHGHVIRPRLCVEPVSYSPVQGVTYTRLPLKIDPESSEYRGCDAISHLLTRPLPELETSQREYIGWLSILHDARIAAG